MGATMGLRQGVLPSPMSANNTGFTTCRLGVEWKHLVGRNGAVCLGSGCGLVENGEGGAAATVVDTRLIRWASCH